MPREGERVSCERLMAASVVHVLRQLCQSILPRAPHDGVPTTNRASYFQLLDLSLPLLVG